MADIFGRDAGVRLRQAISDAGITQTELGEQSGVPQSYISRIITGRRGLTPEKAEDFAEVLGIDPGWLLHGDTQSGNDKAFLIPCLSSAAANDSGGRIILDEIEHEDPYEWPVGRQLMRVTGTSMSEIAWPGQRIILADPDRSARDGDLVVVLAAGHGCLFKRLLIQHSNGEEKYRLLSADSRHNHPPIEIDPRDVADMRVVVGVIYE